MTLHYTQASAGSGKTYRIELDVADKLARGELTSSEIIAVTFTKDAAAELKERISRALIARDKLHLASDIMSARIGTVHSVFGKLLTDFAFELGLSPRQRVLDDSEKKLVLAEALDSCMSLSGFNVLNNLSLRLSVDDWRKDVLRIIGLMRENALTSEKTDQIANDSIAYLDKHLPSPSPNLSESAFISELKNAVTQGKQIVKPTVGLTKAISDCEAMLRQPALKWQNWVKVSKLKPTKMGEPIFAQAMAAGLNVLQCPNFQQEMAQFISQVLTVAQQAMNTFDEIKRSRGLIDFTDQEKLALTALEHPLIRKRLKEEVRYLIIDEFQDTSPLQLALFSKMSELAEDVLMVGDAKQAIYGFRGSDPKLTLDVLNYVQKGGGDISSLSESWRSRPGLVEFSNELFTEPFSHQLSADQVQLTSQCSYQLPSAELGWWTLEYEGRKNNERIRSALAEGIRQHIQSGIEVWDKNKKTARLASWRDLAVLCRGNDEAAELASCCARIGIPVTLERSGLLETPEVSLALACLRRLIDPSDSLASAEIITLDSGNGPEVWLKDRIEAVTAGEKDEWNNGAHPTLVKLVDARQHMSLLSTKEALDLAMLTSDVAGTVCRWKEGAKLTEHRLANIARLSQLVDDYESHCQTQFLAATPTGFILWLKDLEQQFTDKQAANPGDAITITTYHRSKGLEWPIVICSSLDSPLKVSLFGPRIIDNNVSFDWSNPLTERSLCYWPNPFPDQKGNDALSARLAQTKEWTTAEHQARNEAIQLLYVGFTRARDQLILTAIGNDDNIGDWLGLINNGVLPPQQGAVTLSSGATLNVDKQSWMMPDTPINTNKIRQRYWLAPQIQFNDVAPATYFQPASKVAIERCTCEVIYAFGSRISINGNPDMDRLGSVLHHCLALILTNPNMDIESINELLSKGIPGTLRGTELLSRGLELTDWIERCYPGATLHTELAINQNLNDGSLRQGSIDLAVETSEGWVIIDHKSNPQSAEKWPEIASKYSGQLKAYGNAVATLTGKPVIATLVHFSVSGGLVAVNSDDVI